MARRRAAKKSSGSRGKRRSGGRRQPVTPDDLTRLCFVGDPRIASDGTRILFTRKHVGEKHDYVTNLWVVDADGGPPRQFTSGGKDSHGRFSPDGSRIALIREHDDEPPQIHVLDADGGEAVPLTDFPEGSIREFRWSPDGSRLAVAFRETPAERTQAAEQERRQDGRSTPPWVVEDLFYRLDGDGYFGHARHALFVVDAEDGSCEKVFDRDDTGRFSFDWSPTGKELVVAANTSRKSLTKPWKSDLYRVPAGGGKPRKITGLPKGEKNTVRWSPAEDWIAFVCWEGKELWSPRNGHLLVCRPDGSEVRDLSGEQDYCLEVATLSDTADAAFGAVLEWSPDGRRIFAQLGWHGEQHVASVPVAGGEFTFHTRGRKVIGLGNVSADGSRMALTVADATRPPEIALGTADMASGRLKTKRRTRFNDALLKERELARPEPHWIESASGTPVHCWVMRPPGSDSGKPKPRPCVIEVHGGPHAQYGETFFHEFQVLAAAGYVVVYGNPRGSKGYGEEHCVAIKGAWGRADWEDVQAITDFARDLPFVDADRMGIMGGSYGGYMTNWAIAHSDAYRAAITDRCVSNFLSMAGTSDLPLVPDGYWPGAPWEEPEELWEQSPIRHFGNVDTPTLVIHSEGDLRCNVEQGEQIYSALVLRGVPARFVRYPRETSHGLSRGGPPDLRLHRLNEILEWWNRWLR